MITSLSRRQQLSTEVGRLERMLEIRAVEESIQNLYNDGHVRGSTHLANGQEAVSVGIATVLRPSDVVTCTYRGHAAALALGVTPEGVLGEICGRVIGCSGGIGGSMHLMDASVGLMPTFAIVGAGLPVAAGVALAAKLKKNDSVALTIFGDGSTNIGAFHETLNMASIFKLPVIFVIENNLYGEYTRINLSTPISDLADRADSYAMRKEIVDGQDIDAVISSISAAVEFARAGNGPSLIEAKTYRYSGHSRSDPATYRLPGELDQWKQRDPLNIAAERLISKGTFSGSDLEKMKAEITLRVSHAIETVLASDGPSLDELLKHVQAGGK
ncbi:MAG: thiamine pyrophosphate-dependent dehydrogenase E1 component subunit alpha [Streptomycetaceae bacterium]|nr:MAG: thiamine pyrophosphate-dependent dehydrogenase E1 component subunit alpha [Streptomycetaceae bacterium]GDX25599.1 pyruvate dehydrogenase E1 component subunit alpha [Actinomycetes bacterium]